MNYQDTLLLLILLIGSIVINWSTIRRDFIRLSSKRPKVTPSTLKSKHKSNTYVQELEEAA